MRYAAWRLRMSIVGEWPLLTQPSQWGAPQLGEFEAGLTAALWGPVASVVIGGTGAVLAAAAVAWRVPSVVRYRVER